MNEWMKDLPVQKKLRFAILLTSMLALTLACGVFIAVEYIGYRRNLSQMITTLARVMAESSVAPVAFADRPTAQQTLDTLRTERQIVAAALYDASGAVFSTYAELNEKLPETAPELTHGVNFQRRHAVSVHPLEGDGRRLGTLYLRASLDQMYERMQVYTFVVLVVMGSSFAFAWLLSSILQRTISKPILELAETATAVSSGSDYSLRARQYGSDELGQLTAAFNAMLERTQTAVGALRESEARFRNMADGAPVLIWIADTSKARTWFNQRWLTFVGRPIERELGDGWVESLHREDLARCLRLYAEAFESRRPLEVEYRVRRNDGEYRWVLDHGTPRFGPGGEFSGYIGSCIDVTDRKLAEQKVAQARDQALAASRAKDDFLAALSHELRTPLNPVLLLASDAAENESLPAPVRQDFATISKHVALEARLIDDLLDLTRITRGKLSLDLRLTDVRSIIADAVATVRPDLEGKKQVLKINWAPGTHTVRGDPVRLQQVFWNVLKNAVKFTREGGSITLETSLDTSAGKLITTITDTGIGMTEAEIARAFDAFSQGDHGEAGGSHRFGGLGLGLAISRMLVELHAGGIAATSSGRNQGSRFVIVLPLELESRLNGLNAAAPGNDGRERATAGANVALGGSSPGSRGRVLVVEDHAPTRTTLAHLLTRRNFEVVTAASLAEGRAAVLGAPFALLVSDIGLPDGTGYTLMSEVRVSHPNVPGVALSGYGMEDDLARSRAAGFQEHLTKPVDVRALDQVINRLLEAEKS